ncbi:hypothetical protein JL722_14919 [Aureococcus anophagefferens]|nr:hypothetical protein JL722_14919 [Aureococcus anophagefferens]
MGAASSLANAAVEQLSGEELVAARAQVQDHVGRLEADNAALKARVALLEGDAAAARPAGVRRDGRRPAGRDAGGPRAAAARARGPRAVVRGRRGARRARGLAAALAAHPEDERCAAALEARALAAARRDRRVRAARGGGRRRRALRRGRRIGRRRLRDVYGVMWDRVARRSDDLAAYVAAAAPCAALDAPARPSARRASRSS